MIMLPLPSWPGAFGSGDLLVGQIAQVHAASDALHRLAAAVYAEYPYHCYAYVTFGLCYLLPWLAAWLVHMGRGLMGFDVVQSICGTSFLCVVVMLCVFSKSLLGWLVLVARNTALGYLEDCGQPVTNVLDKSEPGPVHEAEHGLHDIRTPVQTANLLEEYGFASAIFEDSGHILQEAGHTSADNADRGDLIIFGADTCTISPIVRHDSMDITPAADSPAKNESPFVRSRAVSSSLAQLDVSHPTGKSVADRSQTLPVARIYPMKDVTSHRGAAAHQRSSDLLIDKGMSGDRSDRSSWVTFDNCPMDSSKIPALDDTAQKHDNSSGSSIASLHLPSATSSITYVRYQAPSPGSSIASLVSIPRLRLTCEPTAEFSYARLDSSTEELDIGEQHDTDTESALRDLLLHSAPAGQSASRVLAADRDAAVEAIPDDPAGSVFHACTEALREHRLQSKEMPTGSSTSAGHVIREKSWLGMFGVREGLQWRPCNALLYPDYLEIHVLTKEGRLKRILHYPTATLRLHASLSLKCAARPRRTGRRLTLRAQGQPSLLLRALSHAHKTDLKNSLEYVMRSAQQAKCR